MRIFQDRWRQAVDISNLKPIQVRLEGPLSSFGIHLSDGRDFAIPHRDFIAVGKSVISMVDRHDSTHTVDALRIVSISDPPRRRGKVAR
jgi:hypothetical protein